MIWVLSKVFFNKSNERRVLVQHVLTTINTLINVASTSHNELPGGSKRCFKCALVIYSVHNLLIKIQVFSQSINETQLAGTFWIEVKNRTFYN